MTPNLPADPASAPLPDAPAGGFRCRRYLFDREEGLEPRAPAGEAPPFTPAPPSNWWSRAPEGRR